MDRNQRRGVSKRIHVRHWVVDGTLKLKHSEVCQARAALAPGRVSRSRCDWCAPRAVRCSQASCFGSRCGARRCSPGARRRPTRPRCSARCAPANGITHRAREALLNLPSWNCDAQEPARGLPGKLLGPAIPQCVAEPSSDSLPGGDLCRGVGIHRGAR